MNTTNGRLKMLVPPTIRAHISRGVRRAMGLPIVGPAVRKNQYARQIQAAEAAMKAKRWAEAVTRWNSSIKLAGK